MGPLNGLRYDTLHDTWVIIAPGREQRPSDQRMQTVLDPEQRCPFCPGAEDQTPPAILTVDAGSSTAQPPWRVRVVPNRFPAVSGSDGRHEVVIVTADHDRDLADLQQHEIAEVLEAVQARVRALEAGAESASVLFFLNAGAGAGASLAHAHGQILATPVVPGILRTEINAVAAWRREQASCLLCTMAAAAQREGRLIAEDPDALLFAPLASRFAWEMLIMPRAHEAHFGASSQRVLFATAGLLGAACRTLRAVQGRTAYNLVLHMAPRAVQDFHWHLELLPRLSPLAGFETGAGFFINPVRPEDAAAALRRALHGA